MLMYEREHKLKNISNGMSLSVGAVSGEAYFAAIHINPGDSKICEQHGGNPYTSAYLGHLTMSDVPLLRLIVNHHSLDFLFIM